MIDRLTKRQAAIIGAFTGILAGPFQDVHEYAEEIIGRPIWTHEWPADKIKEAARSDFEDIVATNSNTP